MWAFCAGLCNLSLFRSESPMPTLQTIGDEGTSTQMFGGRIYETLPMQTEHSKRTKQAKSKYSSAKHRREGGWYLALDVGNGTTKNAYSYQNKFGEKTQNMSGIVTVHYSLGGGGVCYPLVNNVCGIRYSLGYRIHSDTGANCPCCSPLPLPVGGTDKVLQFT